MHKYQYRVPWSPYVLAELSLCIIFKLIKLESMYLNVKYIWGNPQFQLDQD